MNPALAQGTLDSRRSSLTKVGRYEDALDAARRAVELENTNPRYRVRCAEALWKTGNPTDALSGVPGGGRPGEGGASRQGGNVPADGRHPFAKAPLSDYKKAIQFHMKAIEIAEPAAESRHPAIRLAAKEVLVDAHLSAAVDVASGNWQNKDVAVAKWLASAGSRNEDLIGEGGRAEERRLHLAKVGPEGVCRGQGHSRPGPLGQIAGRKRHGTGEGPGRSALPALDSPAGGGRNVRLSPRVPLARRDGAGPLLRRSSLGMAQPGVSKSRMPRTPTG